MPGVLLILAYTTIGVAQPGEVPTLLSYGALLLGNVLAFGLIFVGLGMVDIRSAPRRWLYRLAILSVGTVALLAISKIAPATLPSQMRGLQLVALWAVYGIYYFNEWLQSRQTKNLRIIMNLDKALFFLVVLASLMSALIVNSHPGGLYNQPVPIAIDIARNFQNVPGLVSYWAQLFVVYMCLYLIYYLNHHILIRHALGSKGVIAYLFSGLVMLLVLYPLLGAVVLWLPISDNQYPIIPSQDTNVFAIENFNMGLLVLATSLPLILAFKWQENLRQLSELEKSQLEAELTLLQQQINPHFLFNSLNSLYALALTKSPKAPDAVLQLSSLFRYVVYKGGNTEVPLFDEFSYLSDYLALQRLRMGEACEFDCQFDDPDPALKIAPMMLIVFLENAFKHGLETNNASSWLRVAAHVQGQRLSFTCENSILRAKERRDVGIGLENVRKRLNLQYENRHTLDIIQEEDRFSVMLTVEL